MKAVLQRVARAAVRVDGNVVGQIGRGLLVLLGIGKADTGDDADWMINKLLNLRIFPDDAGKMNRSVTDIGGGILVVPQFTLYGKLLKGTRPSFSDAMPPAEAGNVYGEFMTRLRSATSLPVAEGKFAAMMHVELVNDGPVTIVLDSEVARPSRPFRSQAATQCPPANDTGETPALLFMPFDPSVTAAIHTRRLPHWQQAGCTYFVTFRLADSLPQEKLRQWHAEREAWLAQHPEPHDDAKRAEFQRLFVDRLQQWLDAGYGECWLRRPEIATLVQQALKYFDGQRYVLGEFVIMPNHVHVLVSPLGEWTLEQILHSWKSFTAHEINHRLGRTGAVWQPEYFDRIVRDAHELEDYATYIRQNPQGARPSRPFRSGEKQNGRDGRATGR
jgi:D-tyrosyl-tRNA(Tyr) deacylase